MHPLQSFGGITLPGGRVSRQSQRVRGECKLFQFLGKCQTNVCILCSWNLQKMFELTFHFFTSKTPGEISTFRTFIATFWIFAYFSRQIFNFQIRHDLWRVNYVTPWLIVLIFDRLQKSMEGVATPLDVLQKSLVRGLLRILFVL